MMLANPLPTCRPALPPACLLVCPRYMPPCSTRPCILCVHRWQLYQGSPSQGGCIARAAEPQMQLLYEPARASAWAGCTAGQGVSCTDARCSSSCSWHSAVGLREPLRGRAWQAVLMRAAAAAVVVWACALAVGPLAARSLKATTRQCCRARGTRSQGAKVQVGADRAQGPPTGRAASRAVGSSICRCVGFATTRTLASWGSV
jgi:hypothetical protein